MIVSKTWLEITHQALLDNIAAVRSRLNPNVKIIGVVKSNAYGHGSVLVARSIASAVSMLAVDSVSEAMELRQAGITSPILILGYTLHANADLVIHEGFQQVIGSVDALEYFGQRTLGLRKEGSVHLKIETGTSRQGIWPHEIPYCIELLRKFPGLRLAGVSTHFANIEDTTDNNFIQEQLRIFTGATNAFSDAGLSNCMRHATCSAGALLYADTHFDAIRLGVSLYGLWSSSVTRVSMQTLSPELTLQPVLTWKTRIAQIKTVPAGATISYGRTEQVEQPTTIAILPIGYADGLDRRASSVGAVLIHGKRCKIMGRVCMNMCMVDLSAVPDALLEDEVVIIGTQGTQTITADAWASTLGTINYEVVTRINPLIERRIV